MKNVVLFTIDTLRQDVFGCYGSDLGLTPFIDSIQDKCIRFSQSHSCGPYTQASFPAILTSSHYLNYEKSRKLSPKRTLISEPLQKAGIETAAFHSNAYLCGFFGWNRCWDTFYDSMEANVTDKIPYIKAGELNKRVAQWFGNRKDKDKPFFLWLHYMDVHEPYVPEQKYVQAVDHSIKMTDDEMFGLFTDVLLKRDVSDKGKVELLKKLYLAHLKEVDDSAGEFFGIMENAGVLDDSTVIITADHGDEFGEHGGLSHDGKMFSELIEVPLFIYDSSLENGKVNDSLVSLIDVSPTIVDMFGLEPVDNFEGKSFLPIDELTNRDIRAEAYSKRGRHEDKDPKEVHCYRQGSLKIIYDEKDDSWQLYDLSSDPAEKNNIIDGHPRADELKNQIKPRVRRSEKSE